MQQLGMFTKMPAIPVHANATNVLPLNGLGLSGNTSITVRIYVVRDKNWNDCSIDNLQVTGAVKSVDTLSVTSEDAGATIHLQGNGWAQVDRNYTVAANTFLEFEFAADSEVEIHAVGIVDTLGNLVVYQVFGTQVWTGADQGYHNYSNPSQANVVSYSIPIGAAFTGDISGFVFGQDADAGASGSSWIRNIRLIEN